MLFWVILGLLLLAGIVYLISTKLTGGVVAPNGPRCTDSDGGQAFDLSGTCIQYKANGKIASLGEDECLDSNRLREYYCNQHFLLAPTCKVQIATCANGCEVHEDGSRCK